MVVKQQDGASDAINARCPALRIYMRALCFHEFQEPGKESGLTTGIHYIMVSQSQSKRVLVLSVLPLRPQRFIISHSSFVWLSQALVVKSASPQRPFVKACQGCTDQR